jgi:hypothetical protein
VQYDRRGEDEFTNPILARPEQILGRPRRRRDRAHPGVAVVLSDGRGKLLTEWSEQPLPWSMMTRPMATYQVDVGEHSLQFDCTLPCKGDAHHFQAHVALAWKVHDPAEVVRRNLTDVSAVLRPWVERRMRHVSREATLAHSERAENTINQQLGDEPQVFECGLTVVSFHAKLMLDETEWKHLRGMAEIRRQIEFEREREALAKVQHDHARKEQERDAALRDMRSDRARAVVQQGLISVVAEHLASNPDDQAYVIGVLREEGHAKMRSTVQVLQTMLDARKLEGVDLDRVREQALRNLLDGLKMTLTRSDAEPAAIQAQPGSEPAELPAEQVVVEGTSHKRDDDPDDEEEDRFYS